MGNKSDRAPATGTPSIIEATTNNDAGMHMTVLYKRSRHEKNTASLATQRWPRRQRIGDRAHFVGVAGFEGPARKEAIEIASAALLRPLAGYEAVIGGGW